MRIELLYFDGCPNWTVVEERLARAMTAAGCEDVTIHRRKVATAEEAEQVGFIGSPTIRVDGRDPFAVGEEQVGLACRVYSTPEGLSGSPTVEQLLEALS